MFLASALDRPGKSFDGLPLSLQRCVQVTVLLVVDAFERAAPTGSYAFSIGGEAVRWGRLLRREEKGRDIDPRHG